MQGAARYELYSRSERLRRIERLVAVRVNDCKRIFDVTVAFQLVAAGTTYRYAIRPVSAGGQAGLWSQYLTVTIPAQDQTSPQQLEARAL